MHEGVQTCARAAPVDDRQLLKSVGSARERGRTASLQSFKPPVALQPQGIHDLDRRSGLNRDERGSESPMVYGVIE